MSLLSNLLSVLGALVPSALLLWTASPRGEKPPMRNQGDWASALCAVTGLWWPLQVALGVAALPPLLAIPWSLALLLSAAALVLVTHSIAALDGPAGSVGLAARCAASWGLASLVLLMVVPGSGAVHLIRVLFSGAVVSTGLAVLAGSAGIAQRDRRLLLSAAIVVATVLATSALPSAIDPSPWAQPALVPVLGILAVGALLRHRRVALWTLPPPADALAPPVARETSRDPLTTLPTRTHFERELQAAVVRSDNDRRPLALFFVDLDGFKPVNDTFGHSSGDQVLRQVGERLKASIRSGDVVARIGGDEFVLLITEARDKKAVGDRAKRLIEAVSEKYLVDGREVTVGCSIGISLYPSHGQPAKLIARADAAMYAAKRAGGTGFCFYSADLEDDAKERFDLLRDLRTAVEEGHFELYFQPKVNTASGKITAAEALIRWNHPTRGLLLPAQFMPVVERFGLIRSIGQWVIEEACRQARRWSDCGLNMRVAINLSALQMRQEDIVDQIRIALSRHAIDPRLLTCEITESVAMEDTRATQATFAALGAAGVHLSIDDFGTGYSSLAYLRKLPAEELKIDRTFVMDVAYSPDARAVIDAVVKLAHALGLKVVAEGVETAAQRQILEQLGCDELQGFLFARPMTARALLLWAMDDRQEDSTSFASSLFVGNERQGFATTRSDAPLATESKGPGPGARGPSREAVH
jgi:diguanylate cyclase (GGDEF)-like protein